MEDTQLLKSIIETIESTIDKKVNGKIDRLNDKVDEHNRVHESHMEQVCVYMDKTDKHIEEVKPILEAYRGASTIGNLVKWLAGLGTAVGVLWAIIRGFVP